MDQPGMWAALLREVEREGYGCEFIKYALRLYPMEFVEQKLEEARQKRAGLAPVARKAPEHYLDRMDKKEGT